MEFSRLLEIVGEEPVFETALLLAGEVDVRDVRRQLSRWMRAGKVAQLRRGVYTLAPPYRKAKPHPFLLANRMARGSYVSAQSALAHYGLIPEAAPVTVSVTTGRPGRWETPFGRFEFRHIKPALFYGHRLAGLGGGQEAFLASPEKALLDLVHLHPGADSTEALRALRLQNLERLDVQELLRLAEQSGFPKWKRAARRVAELAQEEAQEYKTL
ncbi:MAG: hypothetical protein FJZ87_14575 [Chloroflexi bacterium]|nr:hypothetical protein [Chloroflexota bacterium]MBM3151415.1 hypothetical protein [Chloroflexota bacterium]